MVYTFLNCTCGFFDVDMSKIQAIWDDQHVSQVSISLLLAPCRGIFNSHKTFQMKWSKYLLINILQFMPFVSLLYLSRISFELREPNFHLDQLFFMMLLVFKCALSTNICQEVFFFLLTPLKSVNCKDIYHVGYNFHEQISVETPYVFLDGKKCVTFFN